MFCCVLVFFMDNRSGIFIFLYTNQSFISMRKFFTLFICIASSFLGFAQQGLFLREMTTSDDYEFVGYEYGANNLLSAVHDSVGNQYSVIDSITYNDLNQQVRLDGWQLLTGYWKHVYYIEYTYNSQGLVASRSNYNFFENQWQLGGIYTYEYNSGGQIVFTELTMGGEPFQRIEYEYAGGKLYSEVWSYQYPFSYQFEVSEKFNYEYDENGRVSIVRDSLYDGYYGFSYNGKTTYAYDVAGNCLSKIIYDQHDDVVEKSIYTFDEQLGLVADTHLPSHPELSRPVFYDNVNLYVKEAWYTLDVEHVLQYVCDYDYTYDYVTSVADNQINGFSVYPNPASNHVVVNGCRGSEMTVADVLGNVVLSGTVDYDSQVIDVSHLPAGVYVMKAGEKSTRFVVR